ncbi:hypothetical protein MFRU_046g00440 [Monilinia fructicola]|uniref:Uncharacterized protein n=1 Tax=Monilinia fructicola TaxID=38448 RepID=A0A5M9JTX9_MONFR|nr:hypothetical protein EYC84_000636 [Monilinia fructicola]KAG4026038.1 hypothetical protein MFRU_046g00440 [Monilinia fructicola]
MRDTLRTESTKHHGISSRASTATPIRQNNESSSSNGVSGNASDRTPRTIPSPSKYSVFPTDNRAETVVDGDGMHVNGTEFPIADAQKHASSPTTDSFGEKRSYIIEERVEPISLEGVVDLTNTVDTTVHEKVAPAVTHEKILPTEHEIITRAVYREIHQHHYYHRALPVIDTEILPTKHYVYGDDGDTLVRIPESMVPCHTITGSHSQNWSIVQHRPAPAEDPFDSPLFGVEPELPNTKYTTHFQPNSKGQLKWSHVPGEPIKVMEREYITAEGFPRKETWWRYPPVLATAAYEAGLTVPMYWNHVPAGTEQPVTKAPASTSQTQKKIKEIRDLERAQAAEYNSIDHLDSNMEKLRKKKRYSGLSNSDSIHAQELNGLHSISIPRKPIAHQKIPERPSTRDSGYDGLDGNYSPNAKESSHYRHSSGSSISSLLGKVRGDDGKKSAPVEGEATKYLQRMREKRRSSGSSVGTVPRSWGRRSEDVGTRSQDIHGGPALTDRPKKLEHHFGVGTAI